MSELNFEIFYSNPQISSQSGDQQSYLDSSCVDEKAWIGMPALHFMAVHAVDAEIFESGPKWWAIHRAMSLVYLNKTV